MNFAADFVVSTLIVAAIIVAVGYLWGKWRVEKREKR